jgi:serine/threonine protein kinase
VKFDNAIVLFQHLFLIDEDKMMENLPLFIKENEALYDEVTALIDAHYKNQKNTEFKALIGEQSEALVDDANIHNLEGAQVGPYQLRKKLGQGGMGAVYLGERNDGQLEQKVAIKFVYPSIAAVAGDNFLQKEAQHLANLDHTNIAKIYTLDITEDDLPYMVMEFVDGLPIDQYCDEHHLNLNARLKLFQKVCGAVHNAHQNMVIHADIKPSNILVDKQGEPKLMDFGIAKIISINHESLESNPTLFAASQKYASPEQIARVHLSSATDIYSLGKLLNDLNNKHHNPEVIAVVSKATQREEINRYNSILELLNSIDKVIDKKPLNEFSISVFYKFIKFISRNKMGSALTLIIVTLSLGFSVKAYQDYQSIKLESAKYQSMSRFVTDMLRSANSSFSQKKQVLVADVLDKGLKDVYEKQLSAKVKIELIYALTRAYKGLGEFERYLTETKKALLFVRKVFPDEAKTLITFNVNVGIAYENLGQFEQAYDYYKTAAKIAENIDDRINRANTYHQLGNVLFDMDRYEESIGYYEQALLLSDPDDKDYARDIAVTTKTMGIAYSRSGQHEKALELYNQSYQMREKTYGLQHTKTLNVLMHQAQEYNYLERCEEALIFLDQVERGYALVYKLKNPEWLSFFLTKAKVYRCLQNYPLAEQNHLASINIAEVVYQKKSYVFGIVTAHFGITKYYQAKHQGSLSLMQSALVLLKSGRNILSDTRGEQHSTVGLATEYIEKTTLYLTEIH